VLELMETGGWLMWPILACSVVALAIIVERFWTGLMFHPSLAATRSPSPETAP